MTDTPELTWENARYVKGPYVALFFERHKVLPNQMTETDARRLLSWRSGTGADFYRVDKMMTAYGFHPYMLQTEFGDVVWTVHGEQTEPFPVMEDEERDHQVCRGCEKVFVRIAGEGRDNFWRRAYCTPVCRRRHSRSRATLGKRMAA